MFLLHRFSKRTILSFLIKMHFINFYFIHCSFELTDGLYSKIVFHILEYRIIQTDIHRSETYV